MTVRIERRASVAALWARRFAIFGAVLMVVATAAHRFAVLETPPFLVLLGMVVLLALGAVVLAIVGFMQLWERGDRGGRAATRALLVALVVLVPFGIGSYRAFTLPALNDVSTDVDNPPVLAAARASRGPGMNEVGRLDAAAVELQIETYPEVTGRRFQLPADRMFEIAAASAENLGWPILRRRPPAGNATAATIDALAPSYVFGFVSDVAIRIIEETESSYVDVRSASRYGVHDLGDNAAKIVSFFDEVDAEIMRRNAPIVPIEMQ